MATYNSILKQSYKDWEWLVTDDCSIDGTFELLNEICLKDKRVKVFRNDMNLGAAVSRNKSIANANGEFIAFIDSDDIWLKTKLEQQLSFMNERNIDFSFTAYELIDEEGNLLGTKVDSKQEGFFTYKDMLKKKATLGCSTVVLRLSAFGNISMPLIRTGQDYALWLNILKTGCNAWVLSEVLTQYRIMPNSISRNKFKKAKQQWYIYRHLEHLSIFNSLICFGHYAFRAVFRR